MTEEAAFPAIFNLTPLMPLLPLAAFVLIVLWANRSKKLSAGTRDRRHRAVLGPQLGHCLHHVRPRGASASNPFRIFAQLAAHGHDLAGVRLCGRPAHRRDALHGAVRLLPDLRLRRGLHGRGQAGEQLHDERGKPAEPGHVDRLASRFFAYIALFATGHARLRPLRQPDPGLRSSGRSWASARTC